LNINFVSKIYLYNSLCWSVHVLFWPLYVTR